MGTISRPVRMDPTIDCVELYYAWAKGPDRLKRISTSTSARRTTRMESRLSKMFLHRSAKRSCHGHTTCGTETQAEFNFERSTAHFISSNELDNQSVATISRTRRPLKPWQSHFTSTENISVRFPSTFGQNLPILIIVIDIRIL